MFRMFLNWLAWRRILRMKDFRIVGVDVQKRSVTIVGAEEVPHA